MASSLVIKSLYISTIISLSLLIIIVTIEAVSAAKQREIIKMMQRFTAKRSLQNVSASLLRRCISSTSQTASVKDTDEFLARLPPFDYTPPPYSGPSADEVLNKRKEFLSPSMPLLFRKPVTFFSIDFVFFLIDCLWISWFFFVIIIGIFCGHDGIY